ncbi:unnamed protein product [Rotaria sordida]|uniref:G-protein coupled receptors family 1 profile domain-containing protein n=1 Tax=Rotaria sordida TaxID=392033 RepID=A0A819H1K2_9BILA|nr:unnamed protein product [Rotaria sordida]CAF3888568.1 unnamed protein product [Rotaria sordida]
MLTNTTTTTTTADDTSAESLIVAYYSLILIIIGTVFNFLTFLILCRSTFRDKKTRPIIHYMRTIAIFDILMLYGWNLDHYLVIVHKFRLLKYSIVSCKFISFISYFTSQTSAWLRIFVCLDRYLSLSYFHRAWMSRSKTVLIIITCVIMTSFLLNLHILIFGCYRKNNGIISIQARSYRIYPLWNHINLGVYNCVPFILMVILNSGVSYHLLHFHRTNSTSNPRIQNRIVTLTLVITTSLFLVMTIPATVASAFFMGANVTILHFLDGILYTYHVLSFPLYLITFNKFRQECIRMLTWKFCNQKVTPLIDLQ